MIEVVEYSAVWPIRFLELREAYADALRAVGARWVSIEHVGSTAVPGLAAKPVIDIDIVVEEADTDAATAALRAVGFVSRGTLGIEGRTAFVTPQEFAPSNTYVMTRGSLALRNHLAVRDVLRADDILRDEYNAVKRRAAASAQTIDDYLLEKSEVLARVLRRAGLSEQELAAIDATNREIAGRGAYG